MIVEPAERFLSHSRMWAGAAACGTLGGAVREHRGNGKSAMHLRWPSRSPAAGRRAQTRSRRCS